MNGFIFIALLMTLLVLAAVLFPLLRGKGETPAAWRTAGVVTLLLVAGVSALYPVWSNWVWERPLPAADSPAAMVVRLERRLEKQPDDLDGWLQLGRSYLVLEKPSLAVRAYQRADSAAKGRNADALMGLAEALIGEGRSDFAGRAGRLFEQALEVDPKSVKALFYSASAAAERNELPLARSRLQRLIDGNPPADVRKLIEDQMRSLDGMIAMAAADPAASSTSATAATAEATKIVVQITMAPGVAGKANAGAPLFVLARVPGQRGPPLAAKRLDAKFPQEVELLSTDAPMGSGFVAGQDLEIEARVANGGSAISRSGDPFGVVRVKVGAGSAARIEINQLKP